MSFNLKLPHCISEKPYFNEIATSKTTFRETVRQTKSKEYRKVIK